MCDQLVQARTFTVKKGKIKEYSVLAGEFWLSGYDERVSLYLEIEVDPKLKDGRYVVVFTPVDLDEGSDAVENVEIYKLVQIIQ